LRVIQGCDPAAFARLRDTAMLAHPLR